MAARVLLLMATGERAPTAEMVAKKLEMMELGKSGTEGAGKPETEAGPGLEVELNQKGASNRYHRRRRKVPGPGMELAEVLEGKGVGAPAAAFHTHRSFLQ